MRKSIGAATAALVVAGSAFMACGGTSEDQWDSHYSYTHPMINCVQTEILLRGRQGLEVTEEDRTKIEEECRVRIRG